jgi:hypothetical protein
MLSSKSMAESQREVELPTFIDMVFLLLVFFIVSLSFSPDTDIPVPPTTLELPKVKGTASNIEGGQLATLTLQIEKSVPDMLASPKVLYILKPSADVQTEEEALKRIKDGLLLETPDSTNIAVFPGNLLSLSEDEMSKNSAFKLIADSIKEYKDEHFNTAGLSNTIEVIADIGTEFKIINYILTQCSEFGDKIPKVTFRVMPPGNANGGSADGAATMEF